jgi:PAS domain S-box-containing protein
MSEPPRGLDAIADPRALLTGLFELAPVAFQVYRADGHCLLVNDAFRRLFGSEPPPEYNLFHDDILARQGFLDLVRRAFAGETVQLPPHWYDPRELEQLEVREGRRVAISVTLFPLRGASGAVEHVALCFQDVTAELERAEERDRLQRALDALQRSEEEVSSTINSIGDAVIATDATGRIARMNRIAEQLTGWPAAEALHRPLVEVFRIVSEATRAPMDNPVERVLREDRVVGLANHTLLIARDGTERAIADSGAPIRRSDGQIGGVVLVFRDHTAERAAARALLESEARKAAIMEAALDAIVVMDHDGKIVEFNPAAEMLFGYRRDEAVGRPVAETLVPPGRRTAHSNGLARYLSSSVARVLGARIELPAIRRDGTEFPAEIALLRIGAPGKPMFVGYIRDTTERRHAAEAEALRRANEAAEAAYLELEAFSYSVAQDLRSPLRTMIGFGDALIEDQARLDDTGRDHLQRIVAGARRMGEVVDGLLALARLAKVEVQHESFDLAALARSLMPLYLDPARHAVWNIAPALPVRGDRRLVRTLLEHLLSNAWKFTRTRGVASIELGCSDREDGVYYVRDNGIGFDRARAQALFAPFQRHHVEVEYAGAGLGLATAQRIVHRHGGRIWAEASVDAGATFYFTLASAPPPPPDRPAP